jgi:Ras GTPase-activating-like protein IQGAP2/3
MLLRSRQATRIHQAHLSTLSSAASSGYSGHKRGLSEATGMSPSATENRNYHGSLDSSPDGSYKNVRQSLRPLPQAPGPSPPSHRVGLHSRTQSMDVVKNSYGEYVPSVNPQPASIRPNSMILSRSDSIKRGARSQTLQHQHSPLTAPDLQSLQKSSTSQLRTLSQFAENGSPEEFNITTREQEVVGLHGRRRLQRSDTVKPGKNTVALHRSNGYGWEGRNWMDKQRQFLQAYEYLCHIGEAKEWIEDILQRPIPPIVQLEEALRDGVTLAEIVDALYPERRIRIFRSPKLQFRHSDNIAIFFRFLAEVELPDLFRFELIDLYEKKNIPKVIYCIHALSWLLFRKGIVDFRIGNLVGQLEFEHHELEAMQKG